MQNLSKLNDNFRSTFIGGKVLITTGIKSLAGDLVSELMQKVQTYDDFTPDNDPYGEHDFGSISLGSHKFFWKIDYYAHDMMYGSENPADPSKTVRVLTIMLAEEY